jgi:hypothetical protein
VEAAESGSEDLGLFGLPGITAAKVIGLKK